MAKDSSVLFLRDVKDADAEDVWDDTLLLQTWEKSINQVKKMCDTSADSTPSDTDNIESKEADLANGTSGSDSETANNKSKKKNFFVGQNVRAPYSVDGLEYEGIITKLMNWKKSCIVKFLGYENEEEVFLADLKKSHGIAAIKNQVENAKFDALNDDSDHVDTPDEDCKMELEEEISRCSDTEATRRHVKSNKKHCSGACKSTHPPVVPVGMPPPPNFLPHRVHSEQEAYTSMLMSWYLNGYHTGYYEGLKHAKEKAKPRADPSHSRDDFYSNFSF